MLLLPLCEPTVSLLLVLQECLHEDTTDADIDQKSEERVSEGRLYDKDIDYLDSLLLRSYSDRPDVVEQVGYVKFDSSRVVWQILKARRTVKEKVITLIWARTRWECHQEQVNSGRRSEDPSYHMPILS
jgi:chorismate mutase